MFLLSHVLELCLPPVARRPPIAGRTVVLPHNRVGHTIVVPTPFPHNRVGHTVVIPPSPTTTPNSQPSLGDMVAPLVM
jgi:hypothetical protein